MYSVRNYQFVVFPAGSNQQLDVHTRQQHKATISNETEKSCSKPNVLSQPSDIVAGGDPQLRFRGPENTQAVPVMEAVSQQEAKNK